MNERYQCTISEINQKEELNSFSLSGIALSCVSYKKQCQTKTCESLYLIIFYSTSASDCALKI